MRQPPRSSDHARRIARLQEGLKKQRLDAMLVFDRHNTFYLTGLRCTLSFLFVTPREAMLLVDGRYIESARAAVTHCDVRLMTDQARDFAAWHKAIRPRTIGFEGSTAWHALQKWRSLLPDPEWRECGDLILEQRRIKSPAEAKLVETSARLNDAVYAKALAAVRAGATELDLRNVILSEAYAAGAEGLSFDSIVASDAMSARPHYSPGPRPLQAGQLLLIDMGMLLGGYCSDMTRVVGVGRKPNAKLMKAYEATLKAEVAALDAVGPGVACADLDRIARESLKRAKLDRYFTHGLGHGVGLEIHEAPTLNARSKDVLRPGMVITIEPGVYLPGLGGIRIEDLVLVTRTGHKVLSRSPKDFRVISLS